MEYPELPEITWREPIFVLGLTGAIGSGKSSASRYFAAAGARLLEADALAHEALNAPELRESLLLILGPEVLDEAGAFSRPKIARIVFEDERKLKQLNRLIHPWVQTAFEEYKARLEPGEVLVYDVPLLFEAADPERFDMTLVVSAAEELRFQRVRKRSGWDKEEWRAREAFQIPLSEKEKMADLVLRNESSPEDLRKAVENIYGMILKKGKAGEDS